MIQQITKHPFERTAYERDLRVRRYRQMTSLFAQAFSPDGRYLLSASNFGVVTVWDLESAIKSDGRAPATSYHQVDTDLNDTETSVFAFRACEQIVYTMVFCGDWLVVGTSGGAIGWRWSTILASRGKELGSHTVFSGLQLDTSPYETNQLAFCPATSNLFEAAGDGRAYVIDLERQARVGVFEGHSDYLHCLQVRRTGDPVTGSEDGTVRLWDARTRQTTHVLAHERKGSDYKTQKTWVASLAVDRNDDWLVCTGGGMPVTLYHLRSMGATCEFPKPSTGRTTVNAVCYHEGNVLCGGDDGILYSHGMDGNIKRRTHVAAESIYSICINEPEDNTSTKGFVAVSGMSPDIDVLTASYVRTCRIAGMAL